MTSIFPKPNNSSKKCDSDRNLKDFGADWTVFKFMTVPISLDLYTNSEKEKDRAYSTI